MKHRYLIALLPMALAFAGCEESVCTQAVKAYGQFGVLKTQVSMVVNNQMTLEQACQETQPWNARLGKYRKLALRAQSDLFYWEETQCLAYRRETRCTWHGGRHDRYRNCRTYTVCVVSRTIPHYRDGYEDAGELADYLGAARTSLREACVQFNKGNLSGALVQFEDTEPRLSQADSYFYSVLTKGGCSNYMQGRNQ